MTELTTLKKLFSIILMVIGSWSVEGSFTNTDELILVMGQTYKLNVNMTSRIILGLTAPLTLDLPSPAIRIHISANKTRASFPLMIQCNGQILERSWKLPSSNETQPPESQDLVAVNSIRTVLIANPRLPLKIKKGRRVVEILISTFNPMNTVLEIRADYDMHFVMAKNQVYKKVIDLDAAAVAFVPPTELLDHGLFKVTSPSPACMRVSWTEEFPEFEDDWEGGLSYSSQGRFMYQSATESAGIKLPIDVYPNGFYVSMEVMDKCWNDTTMTCTGCDTKKPLTYLYKSGGTNSEFSQAIWSVMGAMIATFLLVIALTVFFVMRGQAQASHHLEESNDFLISVDAGSQQPGVDDHAIETDATVQTPVEEISIDPETANNLVQNRDQFVNDFEASVIPSDQERGNQHVQNAMETISDLITVAKTNHFLHITAVGFVVVFPVAQLAISNGASAILFGDLDRCAHNYLCSYRYLGLYSFNGVYSSLCYVGVGIIFNAIVVGDRIISRQDEEHGLNVWDFHYALGITIMLEGVMSACYHLCPTKNNLQFDVIFIYLSVLVLIMKNYHVAQGPRHSGSGTINLALVGTVLISILGTLLTKQTYLIAALLLNCLLSPVFGLLHFYTKDWREVYRGSRFSFSIPTQFRILEEQFILAYTCTMLLVTLALTTMVSLSDLSPRATLFAILGLNLTSSFGWTYWKLYKPRWTINNGFFIVGVISLAVAIVAILLSMVFFVQPVYNAFLSPEESKSLNQECQVLNFYDFHDLWHFASGIAALALFVAMFFFDKGLENVPRAHLYASFKPPAIVYDVGVLE